MFRQLPLFFSKLLSNLLNFYKLLGLAYLSIKSFLIIKNTIPLMILIELSSELL